MHFLSVVFIGVIQGGEDPLDALSCRSFFAKEPLIIGLFCGKLRVKIRYHMDLRPPVWRIRECGMRACSWMGHDSIRESSMTPYKFKFYVYIGCTTGCNNLLRAAFVCVKWCIHEGGIYLCRVTPSWTWHASIYILIYLLTAHQDATTSFELYLFLGCDAVMDVVACIREVWHDMPPYIF